MIAKLQTRDLQFCESRLDAERAGAVQSKEGVQCFTDGCTGQVKLAQELEEEAGIDTHRRELLRLPDQAKKPERPPQPPQEQPEQRRGRKKGPAQRLPEPGWLPSASLQP